MRVYKNSNLEDCKMVFSGNQPMGGGKWIELGLAIDEESGIAAQVSIQRGPRSLPGIQLGTLLGSERRFSPYVHPNLHWENGRGNISQDGLSIPKGLMEQIE